MLTPVIRTSFAFNLATIHAIEALAEKWDVSKSEAVRKAVLMVNEETPQKMTPLQALQALKDPSDGISQGKGDAYLKELKKIRKASWGKFSGKKRGS